nr:ABC transporter ATP-binding protein [uncultured Draconibacterium sp.]
MADNRFIVRSFGLFFNYKPIQLVLLFLISLLLGFSQGISIVLLIPLLGLLSPETATDTGNKWADFADVIFSKLEIEVNLSIVLSVFAFSLIAIAVLTYFQSTIQAAYQQEFSFHIRKQLFKKLITSDWSFLNGKSKHSHIQVLTTEIPKMTTYYYFYLGLTSKTIFILTHVFLAAAISMKFTFFVVITGLLVFVLLQKYLKKAIMLGAGNIQAFRKMLKQIDDFWLTVKMAKVHNSEKFYFKKFEEANMQMLDYQYSQLKNRAIPQFLFSIAGIAVLIAVVFFAFRVFLLPMTFLFVLILLFARIFPQFSGLNNDLNMLVSNVESVKLILNMDKEMEEGEFCKKRNGAITIENEITINRLNFGYVQGKTIFTDFSARIKANEITGIIGKSGCGKTTLIDIIAGLQNTATGIITIDGKNLTEGLLPQWRNSLGYLPQDSFFVDGTIRDNLIWDSSKCLTNSQIYDILKQVNADGLVRQQSSGLNTSIANYAYHFSGGERQRLALARVLIREPKLLLLDEATSALDPKTEKQIMEHLVKLKKQITIVFVTHRHNLKYYFDNVIDFDSINKSFC